MIRRAWITLSLSSLLFLPLHPAVAGKLPQPSEAAFAAAEKLRARRMGVDRAGNLWAWNHRDATVQLISPSGSTLARVSLPRALRVNADEQWGVVAVLKDGWELGWIPWNGGTGKTIRMPSLAHDVAWISPGLVAVSPQMNANRVEVWDLEKASLVRAFGEETPLTPGFGATRMRTIRLVFDDERQQLYTFDGYLGDLHVYSLAGELLWKGAVENPRRAETEAWLADVEREAKANRDAQTPLITHLDLALAGDGSAWVSTKAVAGSAVALTKIGPRGIEALKPLEEPCPSPHLLFWGDRILFYRLSASGGPDSCVHSRRFP